MIQNPIFKGFNPDPCICRKGDDYYIAVSTFEWMSGIPVYHSKDIKGPWSKPVFIHSSGVEWSYDGENYQKIGRIFDTTRFSDEYCAYGEFTGTMVGITCADRILHKKYADFDFFEYIADESEMVV